MILKAEQKAAIFHNDGDLLVSASAGSGKTFVMIERIARLMKEGKLHAQSLLAVTFTEKAAGEMREKLTEALLSRIDDGEKSLRRELVDLPMADICTIDAFCLRLVKRYFYKLEISRDFENLAGEDRERLKDAAMREVFDAFYEKKDAGFLRFIRRYAEKRSDKVVRELVEKTYAFLESEKDVNAWWETSAAAYAPENARAVRDEYLECLKKDVRIYENGLIPYIEAARSVGLHSVSEYMAGLHNAVKTFLTSDANALLKMKDGFSFQSFPRLTGLSDAERACKDDCLAYAKEVKDVLSGALGEVYSEEEVRRELAETASDADVLFKITKAFFESFDEKKREENKFDFSDVERFALTLLSDEEVAKSVRDKYAYVFIDEYQDVNSIQDEIFRLLSKNNEFMVGDVKQSIYAFRGCDVKLFEEKFARYKEKDRTVTINHNFRSADKILEATNDVMSGVMTPSAFGIDYDKTARLLPGGLYPEGTGEAMLYEVVKPARETAEREDGVYDLLKASELKTEEDEDYTALMVEKIITEKLGTTFYELKSKTLKKATYGDFAVLCRQNFKMLPVIKRLVKKGIPVGSEVETDLLCEPGIQVLTAFLRLIDNAEQDVPLAVVLRSKIGGFSAEDLARIRLEGDGGADERRSFTACFHALKEQDSPFGERLRAFWDYLSYMRFYSDFKGAKGVLEKVISDKNLSSYALSNELGDRKEKFVRRFVSESGAADGSLSVRQFLYKIDHSPERFTVTEAGGDNAVKMMTIHKSKGLEFPFVIVVGTESKFRQSEVSGKLPVFARGSGVATKRFDDEARTFTGTVLSKLYAKKNLDGIRRDEARLFYVAMTRARHSLSLVSVVSPTRKPFTGERAYANSYRDYLPKTFPTVRILGEDLKQGSRQKTGTVFIAREDKETVERIRRNLSYRYPYGEDVALLMKTSVTANLSEKEEEYTNTVSLSDDDADTNAELGTAAHAVLENVDFRYPFDLKSEISRLVGENVLEEKTAEKLNLTALDKVMKGATFQGLFGYELYKEKYFVVKLPAKDVIDGLTTEKPVLVQGIIDLLAIKDGEAVIVDYKYSKKSPESLKKTYEKQLRLYRLAVETALDVRVKKTVIVSLLTGEEVEV